MQGGSLNCTGFLLESAVRNELFSPPQLLTKAKAQGDSLSREGSLQNLCLKPSPIRLFEALPVRQGASIMFPSPSKLNSQRLNSLSVTLSKPRQRGRYRSTGLLIHCFSKHKCSSAWWRMLGTTGLGRLRKENCKSKSRQRYRLGPCFKERGGGAEDRAYGKVKVCCWSRRRKD